MIDDTPYIFVDNRKISPIGRSPRSGSTTKDRPWREEQTFGVVDRVSISREAREKSRQQSAQTEADQPALQDLSKTPPISNHLLIYSPGQLKS